MLDDVSKNVLVAPRRTMVCAELLGKHSHLAVSGTRVHIWQRGDTYLARGSIRGQPFGVRLGKFEREAESQLHQLLVDIGCGAFVRPSEARNRLPTGTPPRLSVRELCAAYLSDVRKRCGKVTSGDYESRLVRLIEFAEKPENRRRWPYACNVDREFAIDLRSYLCSQPTTRNGRAASAPTLPSGRQIYNVMGCCVTLLNWAKRPTVNLLPSYFASPFDQEVVGRKPRKDPLRPPTLPMALRCHLVEQMDLWQLLHVAPMFVLPPRPEEWAGLLVGEVDFDRSLLQFGDRFRGADHTKARTAFVIPFPAELAPILRACIGRRKAGPLLRRRQYFANRMAPRITVSEPEDVDRAVARSLGEAGSDLVQCHNDQKQLVRKTIADMGGVTGDLLNKEFKKVLRAAGIPPQRLYDTRGAVMSEMHDAGVSPLVLNYVTGHAVSADALREYVSVCNSLADQLDKYFRAAAPLLGAITKRGHEVGLVDENSRAVLDQNDRGR